MTRRRAETTHDAMDRCRRRLAALLDDRDYKSGPLRQKIFARYMKKSEAWLTNVLAGKRGLRLRDLDKMADFFRLPVSEFVREHDTEMMELTPTERRLIRYLRRAPPKYRDSILMVARLLPTTTKGDDDDETEPKKDIKKPKPPKDDST